MIKIDARMPGHVADIFKRSCENLEISQAGAVKAALLQEIERRDKHSSEGGGTSGRIIESIPEDLDIDSWLSPMESRAAFLRTAILSWNPRRSDFSS